MDLIQSSIAQNLYSAVQSHAQQDDFSEITFINTGTDEICGMCFIIKEETENSTLKASTEQ